jgi:hypothetical protein
VLCLVVNAWNFVVIAFKMTPHYGDSPQLRHYGDSSRRPGAGSCGKEKARTK